LARALSRSLEEAIAAGTSLRAALVNTPSDLETNLVTRLANRMG
jgi:hypothetical protein